MWREKDGQANGHRRNGLSILTSKGQMPFSMIAVILLILAGSGTALMYGTEESKSDRRLDLAQLREMQSFAILESSELDQLASDIASKVLWSSELKNETDLRSRFQSEWQSELRNTYPERRGEMIVRITESSIEIRYLRLSTDDAKMIVKNESKDLLGISSVTLPVYVEVVGNYSLKIESGYGSITRVFDLQRSIYDPAPFLANRLEAYGSLFEGGKNEIENLVRYQLVALCQDRILRGAGSGSLVEAAGTASVIADQDIRNAMNLAILIEQMSVFRTFDNGFLEQTLQKFSCSEETKLKVKGLLCSGGHFDVADLFLLLNDGGHYRLNQMLAQTIYSSVDAIVLRWLDYLHVIELAGFIEQIGSRMELTVANVLESLTGIDLLEASMVRWMSERLLDAGVHDNEYRWLHYGTPDSSVAIAMNSLGFENHRGDDLEIIIQGNHDIDFPSFDVLSSDVWKDFLIGYRSGVCQLAEDLKLFVKSIALNVASNMKMPEIVLKLDPCDSENYLDELVPAMRIVADPRATWFEEALIQADESYVIKDPLGQALALFARENWREIFQMNFSVSMAESILAESIVKEAIAASSYESDSGMVSEIAGVKSAIQNDASWGVDALIRSIFKRDITPRLNLLDRVFGNLSWEGQSSALQTVIALLAADFVDDIPGIKKIVINLIEHQLRDLRDQSRLRSDRAFVHLSGQDGFTFLTENGMVSHESLDVHISAPWIGDQNSLSVKFSYPEDHDAQAEDYPNLHLTDPMNGSLSPFESGFMAYLNGTMKVELKAVQNPGSLLSRDAGSMVRLLPFGFQSSFSCSSGWPLQGVDYRPTMTFDKQIAQFLEQLFNAVMGALQLIGDASTQVFNFLKDCLSKLLTYCMEAVQVLSDFLMNLAQGLRDLVQGAIGMVIKELATSISSTLGQIEYSISFGGLKMILETSIPDLLLGQSRDLLKWTVCVPLLNSNLSFGVRIVETVRSGLDIIGFCTMAGQDWQAGLLVDPLMLVQDHLIEVDGEFPTFSLELRAPEVVQYEKRSFRLSDIPVVGDLLSRIPTPIPGLLASIDAGFEVKYDSPQLDHVVVNEVEFNPSGSDSGNEWVELYNPTDEAVDISGWGLETVHGRQMSVVLGGQLIAPKSYYLHQFPGQFLDNGGESELPVGESVTLVDATGRKVDSTSLLTDHYNDDRTWQRSVDASERWVFKSETRAGANSFQPFLAEDIQLWYETLYDATLRAFAEMGHVAFDLSNLAVLLKNIIVETIQIVAEILARLIVEMSLFIELALQDYSQSFSGGMRLSLVVTGEGVKDALLWISSAVQQALSGITNPTQATMGKRPLDAILDDVHIRFSAYGSASLPRILSDVAPSAKFRLAGLVQVNLASFIPPETGQQDWSVSFGTLFEEVPGGLLNAFFPVDVDKSADCWLFKATIHSAAIDDDGGMIA